MLPDFEGYSLPDLSDPISASLYLAELLRTGQITLFLGAGVSMASGMPSWDDLVAGCEEDVGIIPIEGRSSQQLMQAIDAVMRKQKDKDRLKEIIRTNLYPENFREAGKYPSEVVADRMLIALGALVMNSTRGSVSEVFTMNFDDLLEWYLDLHGFRAHVVTEFPSELRTDRDVAVFHPHGFIPLNEADHPGTPWFLLSYGQLLARLADTDGSRWPVLLESRLLSSHLLAVGTSLSDLDLDVLLTRVRAKVTDRPTGFVIVSKIDDGRRDGLFSRGLVPVVLGHTDAVPEFLLDICRRAASR